MSRCLSFQVKSHTTHNSLGGYHPPRLFNLIKNHSQLEVEERHLIENEVFNLKVIHVKIKRKKLRYYFITNQKASVINIKVKI
jgi:hypothetical protein